MRFCIPLAALILVGCSALKMSSESASISPVDLRCEYLVSPAGLDHPQPRLGWALQPANPAANGQRQTAYHIVVTAGPAPDAAVVWDTGMVTSDAQQQIPYAGPPLSSSAGYSWRVRVRDENQQWSDWSPLARWSMGVLNPAEWQASWIGTPMEFVRKPGWPPPDNTNPDPWLRRVFTLPDKPRRAVLHVASVGYHELYVNGDKVGDAVLAPAVTDHTRRARYVTYDITSLLRPGKNALGLWLGHSWSIFPPYKTSDKPQSPIVLAQGEVTLANGNRIPLLTDDQWRWHPSPNTTIGVWDFRDFGGELYDAGRELPAWCQPDLDDSSWQPVRVFQPRLTLSAQKVEPNRCIRELTPVAITEPKPGVYRLDFGTNFTGFLEARLSGAPGQKIHFKWSEREDQEMTHQLHSYYVMGPSGQGLFRNRFNYGVGRWIQIEGLAKKPALSDFKGLLIRTDYQPALQFSCSSELLNRILDRTLYTYENLSLGGYVVDCAQRERMGYGGDAHATTATGLDAFRAAALYSKWALDWRDVQGKSAAWGVDKKDDQLGSGKKQEPGNLPYTAPTYWGGGGPGWSGYCVTLPWEMHHRFGDRRILEEMFPTIEAWLAFVETKVRDNLLRRYGGEWDFLGDWLWPGAQGVNGDTRETLFFNNCYWVYNLQMASEIARTLAKTAQAQRWSARADEVRRAIHQEFYNAVDHSYVNGSQAYLAIALHTAIPPEEVRPLVAARLEKEIRDVRQGHFWGGIGGGSFIVREMIRSDRNDLMLLMATQETYPGWGDMLKRGATTIWEDWEGNLSLAHSSYLHIGAWFVEGLAGIRPGSDGQGYKNFVLRPGIVSDPKLKFVHCRFESPYGPIESNWQVEDRATRIQVTVPPNTTAKLYLPATPAAIRLDGQSLDKRAKVLGEEDGRLALRLVAGKYSFELNR